MSDLQIFLIIALGSALGGVLRHAINVASARFFGTGWPYGTFIVNVLGSFGLGAYVGYYGLPDPAGGFVQAFVAIGLLCGFTAFAAFSLEIVQLFRSGRTAQAMLYLGVSFGTSLAALAAGVVIFRTLA